jgi:3-oxoacyl-[acyl-carrier protein] reductase
MDLGIRGRKAIVNGGSAGMGKAAALALAREGVELTVSARGHERLAAACEEIERETGEKVTPVAADHSTDEGRKRILAACPAPDILVGTCAPPPMTPDYRAITAEQWRASLEIALLSPVLFMQAVVDGMAQRGWGRIVNIATVAAKSPGELRILSGAPRAALVNYTVAVSKVVAKRNVTINNLLPGMVRTDTIRAMFAERAAARGASLDEEIAQFIVDWRVAAERFAEPHEIGDLAAMLCSDFAGYVTGQSLVVDGGATTMTF